MKTYQLTNGVEIPAIGFGTYRTNDSSDGLSAIENALGIGYRLLDTATLYDNESIVGQAILNSNIDRRDIFLTTKLANCDRGYDSTLRAFDKSLSELKVDYIDLYLIHWPASQATAGADWKQINASTWKAMERLLDQGACRAIGVSNFMTDHLQALATTANVMPMVNQIEFHPGMMQKETMDYCRQQGIVLEGWSPLGRTRLLNNPLLIEIASRHGKSTAQISLRWAFQLGVIPLPKSIHPQRMAQNIDIFDFSLSTAEMDAINAMPPTGMSGLTPDNITF